MEYITLSNGVQMPMLGYGCFLVSPEECERCVSDAIEVGYRAIDTAQAYYNEEGVGAAVSKAIAAGKVRREELFLTTKVWIMNAGYEKAKASIDESLRKLQTNYIDLLLIHQAFNDYYGTWRAMEEAYRAGKVRAIGVSNFLPHHLNNLMERTGIVPLVNQLEFHPGYIQKAAVDFSQRLGIQVEAWSPIGRARVLKEPLLLELAEKYQVSEAQICIRFALQCGVLPLPKSSSAVRMRQNLDVFDFQIEDDDMHRLMTLPQIGWSGEHPDRETVPPEA